MYGLKGRDVGIAIQVDSATLHSGTDHSYYNSFNKKRGLRTCKDHPVDRHRRLSAVEGRD